MCIRDRRRWFGFLRMQIRVAQQLPRVVTVSESSRKDIAIQMGVHKSRMSVVSVGVDHTVFRPRPERPKIAGRIMVTSSSDVPMKGLVPLLEAVAKLRTERDVEDVYKRQVQVRLTAGGERTLQQNRSVRTAFVASRLKRLPAEERARLGELVGLLEKLVDPK